MNVVDGKFSQVDNNTNWGLNYFFFSINQIIGLQMPHKNRTWTVPRAQNFCLIKETLNILINYWNGLDYVLLIKVWAAHTVCLPVCHLYSRDNKDSLKTVNSFLFHTLTAACQCCKARVTKYWHCSTCMFLLSHFTPKVKVLSSKSTRYSYYSCFKHHITVIIMTVKDKLNPVVSATCWKYII